MLGDRRSVADWTDAGSPDIWDRARTEVKRISATEPEHLPMDIEDKIRERFSIHLPRQGAGYECDAECDPEAPIEVVWAAVRGFDQVVNWNPGVIAAQMESGTQPRPGLSVILISLMAVCSGKPCWHCLIRIISIPMTLSKAH